MESNLTTSSNANESNTTPGVHVSLALLAMATTHWQYHCINMLEPHFVSSEVVALTHAGCTSRRPISTADKRVIYTWMWRKTAL